MNRLKLSSMLGLACLILSSCSQAAPLAPTLAATEPLPTGTATVSAEAPTATSTVEPDTGWQGEYFDNDQFKGPAAFRQADAELGFDWADGSPDASIPGDHFSARWNRCLEFEERYYLFTVSADDHARVLLDEVPVLDTNAGTERSYAVSAGRHCFTVEYQEGGGRAAVNFSFTAGEPYPASNPNAPWLGEYFNNPNFLEPAVYTRQDAGPVFDWRDSNPAPSLPVDNFSVRWTRCLDLEGRDYVFTAQADDFVRVFLDDVLLLEASGIAPVEKTFAASAGPHCLKVEYQEGGGVASVNFSFK